MTCVFNNRINTGFEILKHNVSIQIMRKTKQVKGKRVFQENEIQFSMPNFKQGIIPENTENNELTITAGKYQAGQIGLAKGGENTNFTARVNLKDIKHARYLPADRYVSVHLHKKLDTTFSNRIYLS